jgi:hypothetical protein
MYLLDRQIFIRSGAFPLLGNPPFTLGWDVSGVFEEVCRVHRGFRWATKFTECLFFHGRRMPTPNTSRRHHASWRESLPIWIIVMQRRYPWSA